MVYDAKAKPVQGLFNRVMRLRLGTRILLIAAVAVFWVLSRVVNLDTERVTQALEITHSKPAHCREGFPGCVPKELRYIFFLHTPNAGGISVRRFLEREGTKKTNLKQHVWCDLGGAMSDQDYCYSQDGYHSAPELRDGLCSAQKTSISHLRQQPFFERLRCDVASGHYDFTILDTLPREVLEKTLIVVNFREPAERTSSSYQVLKKLDKGTMCPEGKCLSYEHFTKKGRAGELPMDRQLRILAGDYCCYQPKKYRNGSKERLAAAMRNLQRVGVVIVTERMSESLEYLSHVLGWQYRNTVVDENKNDAKEGVDDAEKERLRGILHQDVHVYQQVLLRLEEQTRVLTAAGILHMR